MHLLSPPSTAHYCDVLQAGYGSVIPVSILGCQIACESAAGCDSISYNAVVEECYLKNGASQATCTVGTISF